jgi:hypothetical protein
MFVHIKLIYKFDDNYLYINQFTERIQPNLY